MLVVSFTGEKLHIFHENNISECFINQLTVTYFSNSYFWPHSELQIAQVMCGINQSSLNWIWILVHVLGSGSTFRGQTQNYCLNSILRGEKRKRRKPAHLSIMSLNFYWKCRKYEKLMKTVYIIWFTVEVLRLEYVDFFQAFTIFLLDYCPAVPFKWMQWESREGNKQ